MEDGDDPETVDWVDRQNQRTRAFLDTLPDRPLLRQRLDALGIGVAGGRVSGVETDGQGRLAGVRLDSGNTVPVRTLVVAPRFRARAAFLRDLGLAAREHPSGTGEHLPVDATGFTGVEGVWAAGNVTDPMGQVITSAAAGLMAGAQLNFDLVSEDTARAVQTHRSRYASALPA